jgi:uncharacterized protein YqhQ
MTERMPSYGGQAVLEGVMMRGQRAYAVAVRAPDGTIVKKIEPLGALYRSPIARIPFLRGLVMLWDALVLGIGALTFSANVQTGEEERLEGAPLVLSLLFSLALGIGLFILLPAGTAFLLEQLLHLQIWASNSLEGVVRLLLLIGYIWAVGRIPEIGRVYAYHGAEHKTINAYEAEVPLESKTVAHFSRLHARCGTSFLLTVVVLSVLLFSALGRMALIPRLLSRLALVPILAALAYEYIRLAGRFMHKRWARFLLAPNLALQRLTTREPNEDMIEVALAAFQSMKMAEESTI